MSIDRKALMGAVVALAMATTALADEPVPRAPPEIPGASAQQKGFPASLLPPGGKGDLCVQFQKVPGFSNFVGRVSDSWISTMNGSVDINLSVGHGYTFEQIVQTANPLYKTIQPLKVGQLVRVSGKFTHGNSECGYKLIKIGVVLTSVKPVN